MSALALPGAVLALASALQGTPAQIASSAIPPGVVELQTTAAVAAAGVADSVTASAGVAPDSITVGDHFRAVVRVLAPPGASVQFARFNLLEPVEAVDSVSVARDSAGAWTASYRLVAWTTGDSMFATIPFRVRTADGIIRDLRVRVRFPRVASVLPADSSLHIPRPAKAVIPIVVPGAARRGWLLPAALLFALLAGIVWLAVRRRHLAGGTPLDPRAAALARLDAIERERLPERGEGLAYHVETSRVLRQYLAARAGWGEDLTSTELLAELRGTSSDEAINRELERILRRADRIKFSGAGSPIEAAASAGFGAAVRGWIVEWPPVEGPAPRAEAA
jgi:hypothetical protein